MAAEKDWAKLLEDNGLPLAPGVPVDAQYKTGRDDWWVRTADGRWHWLDARAKAWKYAPLGP